VKFHNHLRHCTDHTCNVIFPTWVLIGINSLKKSQITLESQGDCLGVALVRLQGDELNKIKVVSATDISSSD